MKINLSDLVPGDKVFSAQHGIGVIGEMSTYRSRPIMRIHFEKKYGTLYTESYFLDGRCMENDLFPTLFHDILEFHDFATYLVNGGEV